MTKENIKTIMISINATMDIIEQNADSHIEKINVNNNEYDLTVPNDEKIYRASSTLNDLWLYLRKMYDEEENPDA